MNYIDFLKSKRILPINYGFNVSINEFGQVPFDWQKAVIKWAIGKGRAALFEDCGLGKTIQQLIWAKMVCKKTGGNVLILAPLLVTDQTRNEALSMLGINITVCRCQEDVRQGINITNYEMLSHFDTSKFIGIVLDESSILKSFMGKTKRTIIESFKDVPFKLACTATPAPNDHMELLNHAEFLGVMKSSEALAIWFINDSKSSGKYRLKNHAVKSFWEWVSTWAVCMHSPSDIGYSDEGYILPKLNEYDTFVGKNTLIDINSMKINATSYFKTMRETANDRVNKCAEIVNKDSSQYMVWCYTNEEADMLTKAIPEAVEIRGNDKPLHKEQAARDFVNGNIRVLISKPKIFGFGLNFQHCYNCVFCGLDYSYESYYQSVRRFWRYGQAHFVNVYRVFGYKEQSILDAVKRKEEQQNDMHDNMYGGLKDIQTNTINGVDFKLDLHIPMITLPNWVREEKVNGTHHG